MYQLTVGPVDHKQELRVALKERMVCQLTVGPVEHRRKWRQDALMKPFKYKRWNLVEAVRVVLRPVRDTSAPPPPDEDQGEDMGGNQSEGLGEPQSRVSHQVESLGTSLTQVYDTQM